ncbi:hypothetical protein AGMMS50293_00100 [Spirochaetia bacterium]|nr:hypothetical protein AGMMS50293_00100 [Spirochaetia bacterium]
MFSAFQHSFPDKLGEMELLNGDWTIKAGNETFYWAGGRILPAAEKDRFDYSPHEFEIYPTSVPSPDMYSSQYIETLRLRGSDETRRSREDQHRGFQAMLYGGLARREIESRLTGIEFLGKKINVHRDIAGALQRIDTEIRSAAGKESAQGSSELSDFIASIGQIGGYNWRNIHGERRMSYHSWGMAIDIQPQKPGNKAIYWLWERARSDQWMLIPLEARWKPPDRVIEAFEREGFIWGGKWPLYDNMHFEYRPELHELNRLIARAEKRAINNRFPGQDLHHLYPDGILRE